MMEITLRVSLLCLAELHWSENVRDLDVVPLLDGELIDLVGIEQLHIVTFVAQFLIRAGLLELSIQAFTIIRLVGVVALLPGSLPPLMLDSLQVFLRLL